MNRLKKTLALAVALAMVISTGGVLAAAAQPAPAQLQADYAFSAQLLNDLGLFNGNEQGFELERTPSRTEASVMLVRMLGQEAQALACQAQHPFDDVPQWADRYIAYMYEQGLTRGVSETSFDGYADCTAEMFVTFVLRALGYSDSEGDFRYDNSIAFARLEDVITSDYMVYLQACDFVRGDMALIAAEALFSDLKDSQTYLLEKLMQDNAVPQDKAQGYIDGVDSIFMVNYAGYLERAQGFYNSTRSSTITFSQADYQPLVMKIDADYAASFSGQYQAALVYNYTYPDGDQSSYARYITDGYVYEKNIDGTKEKRSMEAFEALYTASEAPDDGEEELAGYYSFAAQLGEYESVTVQEGQTESVITRTLSDESAKAMALDYVGTYYEDLEGVEYVINLTRAELVYTLAPEGDYISEGTYLEFEYMNLADGEKVTIKVADVWNYATEAPTLDLPSTSALAEYKEVKD